MELVDPEKIRLLPGQSIGALYAAEPGKREEVGLFLRSESAVIRRNGDPGIHEKAGLIKFNDLFLVLTMIRLDEPADEIFDIWWNYHSPMGREHFRRMAEQERLVFHFYREGGRDFSLDRENGFRHFFASLPMLLTKIEPWSDIEFDRAVRGFCAESYPKENLWEMIQAKSDPRNDDAKVVTIDDYPGHIPQELRPFYQYVPGQGHSIRIIPSMLEGEAMQENPEQYLVPAPVRTVLRCGVRWLKGLPVAPIPVIPGHGLAVPPDDSEF